jgi:asparagine synthase (glutamine-hydrolysing)
MCGIFGHYSNKSLKEIACLKKILHDTQNLLSHRGPDDNGVEIFKINQSSKYSKLLALGFTRLSIIDLSHDGHQPMHSKDDRYIIVFNGEIYNYLELKKELIGLGHSFKTKTDTEVLLAAWIQWGKDCLQRLIGMFSFVIFDRNQLTLTFIRDAFGIKPFFYKIDDTGLYFASEIPALLSLIPNKSNLNYQRCYDYLVHGDYDSDNSTFFEGINHLLPAHYCVFDLKTNQLGSPVAWWKPDISTNTSISFDEAAEQIKKLFLESVKFHLRSDVPVGILLSGGIDSSSILSAVRHLNPNMKINTFSYISSDKFSEEKWIDIANEKNSAIGNKINISNKEIISYFDDLVLKQGEPFASLSTYAHYFLYKYIKSKEIKVILEGQGADEILAGYEGYPGHKLLSLLETKGLIAAHKFSKKWSFRNNKSYFLTWMALIKIKLPDFIYIFCNEILNMFSQNKLGKIFKPSWLNLNNLEAKGVCFKEIRNELEKKNKGQRVKEALAHSLTKKGLQLLLRHGDRNSMAFSVESRVPFLSLTLVNFLLTLPEDFLISDDGETKNIFRKAMYGIVPNEILERKDKIGFKTPELDFLILNKKIIIDKWINFSDPLFFDKFNLKKKFNKFFKKKDFDASLWRIINFIRWNKKIF